MSISSYQPFPIAESKTGLFNYVEPWIRPNDAYDPLQDAYTYRGSLIKRSGYVLFGLLTYEDNGISIGVGDGGNDYSGTLAKFPIRAGSLSVTTRNVSSVNIETFTDNGVGVLTGSAGGSGTINYTTGAWTLHFNAGLTAGIVIRASYVYTPTTLTTPVFLPIMAIKQFQDDSNNTRKLVACDTRRASVFNNSSNLFDPLSFVSQVIYTYTNTTAMPVALDVVINTNWLNIAPYTVALSDGANTIHDNGVTPTGAFPTAGAFTPASSVTYSTGSIHLKYSAPAMATSTITASFGLQGDYFTGDETNFFNSTNWRPNSTSTAYLYLTNDVDRITLFDGITLSRPPFPITAAQQASYTNGITSCLDIKVYKNTLLVIRPLIVGNSLADGQSIRWSAQFQPFNFVADVAGNGGELSAPTDSWIFTASFLRDILVCGFQRGSTWVFRFTGSNTAPFRWDKVNESKSIDAPYANVEYDERVTNAGANGLIACDGVNVQRYDLPIVDEFVNINQTHFNVCFSQRFDTLNQTWMLYPSSSNNATTSDTVLIYNFIENAWATYNMPMSCLGIYFVIEDATWNDFAMGQPLGTTYPNWESADIPWNSFLIENLEPVLLGGTHDGAVVTLNEGNQDGVNIPFRTSTNIEASITSARWNPFIGAGERVQFGYVDFYYQINPQCTLTLSFFANNSSAPALIRTLTLDGPTNDDFAWKRIYINLVGEFVRLNIDSSAQEGFKISGMILWARKSGRLTPGLTV